MITLFGCKSNSDDEPSIKDSQTVEISDIKGVWMISSPDNLNNAKLVLQDFSTVSWSDKFGNTYVGPHYSFENVNDSTLKAQGSLVGSNRFNWIHIQDIYCTLRSVGGNKHLKITCDLKPMLPDIDWCQNVDNWNTVNRHSWYFWEDNWFSYRFEVIEYSERQMKLKLLESSIRFCDYRDDYPLRLNNGVVINLRKMAM